MDLAPGGNGGSSSDERENPSDQFRSQGKQFRRHSANTIHILEEFFKTCPHPNERQRQQLGREVRLEPKQIKFWFQNKRTQIKVYNDKVSNSILKAENEQLLYQNLVMKEMLKSGICHNCESSQYDQEGRQPKLQTMLHENVRLRSEVKKITKFVSDMSKAEDSKIKSLMTTPTSKPLSYDSKEPMYSTNKVIVGGEDPITKLYGTGNLEMVGTSSTNPIPSLVQYPLPRIQEMEKSIMIETAITAMGELLELLRVDEPLWIKTSTNMTPMIHHASYNRIYPKMVHVNSPQAWIESSKESRIVCTTALQLLDIFQDQKKWMEFFPTIVSKAGTIDVVDTGNRGGSLKLLYEKLHVLSPFVAPREFILLRYTRKLNPTTWIMVKLSYDTLKDVDASSSQAWMLPSGCTVEDLCNGKSKVTWIEHVQVDDKSLTHDMYKDIVYGSQAYGAKRWLVILERSCERLAFSMMGSVISPRNDLEKAIDAPHSKKIIAKLSNMMVKKFHEMLSMQEKSNFPQFLEYQKNGFRISLCDCDFVANQGRTVVVCVATSIRLPTSFENLFYFFKDDNSRAKWNVLYHGSTTLEIAQISTGSYPGNSISFMQDNNKKLMLQESCIDTLGASLIYAPIEFSSLASIVNGKDNLEILVPSSGFIISRDQSGIDNENCCTDLEASSSNGSSSNRPINGMSTLLTMALQILVTSNESDELYLEPVEILHAHINSTIQAIKRAICYT